MSGNKERLDDYFHCDCNYRSTQKFWIAVGKHPDYNVFYINSDDFIDDSDLGRVNIGMEGAYDDEWNQILEKIEYLECSECGQIVTLDSTFGKQLINYAKKNWEFRSFGG